MELGLDLLPLEHALELGDVVRCYESEIFELLHRAFNLRERLDHIPLLRKESPWYDQNLVIQVEARVSEMGGDFYDLKITFGYPRDKINFLANPLLKARLIDLINSGAYLHTWEVVDETLREDGLDLKVALRS